MRMLRSVLLAVAIANMFPSVVSAAPVTIKELDLMVRMRSSDGEILREAQTRRLAAPLDPGVEQMLRSKGASAALLQGLRAAAIAPPAEAAKVVPKAAAPEIVEPPLPTRAAPVANSPAAAISGAIRAVLDGKLVAMQGDELRPVGLTHLDRTRVFVLYYSAGWCGPCRRFTPKLIEAYTRWKAKHPELELIFISADRDAFNMAAYMRSARMPWPAVRFEAIDARLDQWSGPGIPRLVALTDAGVPITSNLQGRDLSAAAAGAEIDAWLQPGSVARR